MPSPSRTRVGTVGRLGPLVLLAGAVLGADLATVWLLVAATVVWVAWVDRAALRGLRSRWFLLFAAFLVIPLSLWGGPRTWQWGRLALAPAGLELGLTMLGRTIVLWLGVTTIVAGLSLQQWSALFERLGLQGFGFTLGVAFHFLPSVLASATDAWHALRMRGGWRAYRWEAPQRFLTTVVSGALRHVDEIAAAAQARGYDPARPHRAPERVTAADWSVVVLWAVVCLLLRLTPGAASLLRGPLGG